MEEISAPWADAIEQWRLALRAAGRTAQTIETRTEHVRRFARQTGTPGPGLVSRAAILEWAGTHEWARETRRSTYASLRGFYRWAVETGVAVEDPTVGLPAVKPGPAVPRPAPEDAYRRALGAADSRTHVILRLAAEAGLRRAEIAQIQAADMTRDLGGWSILVHGKGERDRLVPLTDSLAAEIRTYLGRRQWLLPSPAGGHLTARHIGKLASRALPDGVTLHMLRHRFATVVHGRTHDLIAVQRLLGHASVATTQRYTLVGADVLRCAVATAAV